MSGNAGTEHHQGRAGRQDYMHHQAGLHAPPGQGRQDYMHHQGRAGRTTCTTRQDYMQSSSPGGTRLLHHGVGMLVFICYNQRQMQQRHGGGGLPRDRTGMSLHVA